MSSSEQVKELRTIANNLSIGHNMPVSLAIEHFRQAADTIESLSAKLQAENMERPAGCCINENTYYIKRSKKKDVIVSIMYNRADNKYHFVNLTERHICYCGFCTIDEAIADMEKQKKEGAIDDFYKIERPKADCGGGWIPCSHETLPDNEVLCCDNRGNMIIGYIRDDEICETGFAAESEHEYMYDCVKWMELPKP